MHRFTLGAAGRAAIPAVLLLWLAALPPQVAIQAAPGAARWPRLHLTEVEHGFDEPVYLTHAGDGGGRLFVVERRGVISIVRDGRKVGRPFLDISASGKNRVQVDYSEQGLLSVAFPPGFPQTARYFYVYYTTNAPGLESDNILARYHLAGSRPNRADPDSEEIILRIEHPNAGGSHNGGQLAFGPGDGYLYVSVGDGGGDNDPDENGQSLDTLRGKILRIDVEAGAGNPYEIPPDNPFVGDAGRDEIWAYGLRNPWRFSFDRLTHDLYIGDVGQSAREEIDYYRAGDPAGQNYGWDVWEGTTCHEPQVGCTAPNRYVPPAFDYATHDNGGCAVTGGFVYRGTAFRAMQGIYFFSDVCNGLIRGMVKVGGVWQVQDLLDFEDHSISSFGEDEAGNLYVTHFDGDRIYRLSADNYTVLPIAYDF